ncbi:MAG: hypothetical protein K0Q66_496 [Chitinophagaceae bacterium]|nr:hypothetical protein [Chitinophagaceae bacterium]
MIACCLPVLFSCSNTNDFDADLDKKVSQPANPSAAGANVSNSVNLNKQNSLVPPVATPAGTQQPVITSVPVPQPAATAGKTTAPGMNPPHGAPGHICGIPEGAPLSSAPKTTTTTSTVPPQNITINPVKSTKKTAPGMNPPHGEPGHVCGIPEGAPLNSAPATPAKAGSTSTTNAPVIEQWKTIDTTKN